MNSSDPQHPWARLTAAARRAPDERETAAPYGFATRVVAQAFAQERAAASLFDRFALRALGVACLLALLSVAVNYSVFSTSTTADDDLPADDPISALLNA